MTTFKNQPFEKLYEKHAPTGTTNNPLAFLCVPGIGETRHSYRCLAPLLAAAGHTIYTADLRGSGDSSVNFTSYTVEDITADMVMLLESLNESKFVVIGNSFTAACIILLQQSNVARKIQSTVILGPFVRDPPGVGPKIFAKIAPLMFPRLYGAAMWTMYWKTLFEVLPSDFEQYKQYLKATMNEPGRLRALVKMIQASKANAGNALRSYNLPLFIGMGTNDPDFSSPVDEANDIYNSVQSSTKRIVMYNATKHYPQIDSSQQLAQDILSFIQESA
ncbi:hydrolase [Thraustotheca clavata]|uniref:Hydrolase n=1 Tax=Thraustotheca clavata TaxID=74557 RepID=A0A1W0A222_9STRA|nr:hydrolase [Thraustotheca clavata]